MPGGEGGEGDDAGESGVELDGGGRALGGWNREGSGLGCRPGVPRHVFCCGRMTKLPEIYPWLGMVWQILNPSTANHEPVLYPDKQRILQGKYGRPVYIWEIYLMITNT